MDDAGDLIGGFDRRVTRQEEWSKLTDGRTSRLEEKMDRLIDEMTIFRAELRAEIHGNLVTKVDLKEERRHNEIVTWTAVGVIVAAMALVATLFQTFQSPTPRVAAPPAVIVQVPAPASPPR